MEPEDNTWISLNNTMPYDIDLHIDLNLNASEDLNDDKESKNSPSGSVKSPTIPIPKQSSISGPKSVTEFNSIGCNVGSKTSSEDFTYVSTYAANIHSGSNLSENVCGLVEAKEDICATLSSDLDNKRNVTESDEDSLHHQLDIYRRSTSSECTISEMSAESVIWLSHRLGPVLTARHLSRNLLRMLTLCYAGKENLTSVDDNNFTYLEGGVTWKKSLLAGDRNAVKVLECLTAIAGTYKSIQRSISIYLASNNNLLIVLPGLYGEQIILLQYFAHVVELLALCKRKLTQNLEGGLISCLALLNHITAYLSDSTVMDVLHVISVITIDYT